MQIKLPVGSYKLPSPQAATSLLLNCYAESARSEKQPLILRRAPGIAAFSAEPNAGPVRGAIVHDNVLYALIGDTVYSINEVGATTALTGTVPGSERVRMSTNGINFVIVRPTVFTGYSSDGVTVTQIVNVVFTGFGAFDVAFIDGYLVFPRPGTAQFFNSGLNALTFNALDIATAEGAPDDLVGLIVDHREIFLAGSQSTELWYDAGNSPGSPFSRSPNGFLELGTAAGGSLAKQDNSVFWLCNDLTVRRLDSGTPVRVSQHGIESLIQRMTRRDDCFALKYTQEGHLFVAFTFPFAGRTIVYDATTKEWHERESRLASGATLGVWRANCIVEAYGKQLVGDSQSGRIGILDPDTHYEWDDPQQVSWRYQGVYAERNRAQFKRFEVVFNPGKGVTVGQGQNPLATLKASDDGGETFRTLPTRTLGMRGNYKTRAVWWNMGMSRDRVYRIDITDPVPLYITDTVIDAEGARL